jgi:hypothetical protein
MESGFGVNLEGFLIKGNLSLSPAIVPALHGDGSVEGSGTLYFNSIREYNETNGVNIQDVLFSQNQIFVPYTSPSYTETTASIVLDGGMYIKTTANATSSTSGGGLTVMGGVSVAKQLQVGGETNVNNNFIKNVLYPLEPTDAATKQYVDDKTFSGNFTTGQVLIAASVGDNIQGYDNLTYDGAVFTLGSTENVSGSEGGSLVVYGGVSVQKDTSLGGTLDVNGNRIINVATPIQGADAVNKDYVDNKTFGNLLGSFGNHELLTGSTDPNVLQSYASLTYDGEFLTLGTGGNILISNTANSDSLTQSTTFVTYGAASVYKNLFVGGYIDVNGNNIIHVADPAEPTDAVNKQYVDGLISEAGVQGNFTTGQVIIADANGNSIRGYDNLQFTTDGTNANLLVDTSTGLILYNTTDSEGLGSGGNLVSYGGASFAKKVYIGGELDVNMNNIKSVADPIEDYDAVNKRYINSIFEDNIITLENDTEAPIDISELTFLSSTRAFICYVSVSSREDGKCSVYTIKGINTDANWYIYNSFIGDPTNVKFFIRRDDDGNGVLQYTNSSVDGTTTIEYRTFTELYEEEVSSQINFTLSNDTIEPVPGLVFQNNIVHASKIIIHVSNEDHTEDGVVFMNILQKNGNWVSNIHSFGDISANISFAITTILNDGIVTYTNANTTGLYTIRVFKNDILASFENYILSANTVLPTGTAIPEWTLQKSQFHFVLSMYATIPEEGKHAFYEVEGFVCDNEWRVNTRFIGDYLGLTFSVDSSDTSNIIKYKSSAPHDAHVKFAINTPATFDPLPVMKGGTGKAYLTRYAVLRGNGTDAILSSSDFIYKDNVLTLGEESQILLQNTTNASGIGTGGSLTVLGGAAISETLFVGGTIDSGNNFIKNVRDPEAAKDAVNKRYVDDLINTGIADRYTYLLQSNATTPTNITNFTFAQDTKAFVSYIYVQYNQKQCAVFCIRGIKRQSNWFIAKTFIGDPMGIDFYMDNNENNLGQMQYTNTNATGVAVIKYTVVTQIKDAPQNSQVNLTLSGNVSEFTSIPELEIQNSVYNAVQYVAYVSNEDDNAYGMYILNALLKDNTWILNTQSTGNTTGIQFRISNDVNKGSIEYTSSNSSPYLVRIQQTRIEKSLDRVTLNAETLQPAAIDNTYLSFENTQNIFQVFAYVEVPDLGLFALYDIEGLYCDGSWRINSQYIGDRTGITFIINNSHVQGVLNYTNQNSSDAIIRYITSSPLIVPLPVKQGGTGNAFLKPNAVLRGNGLNPVLATEDFVYENNTLILGGASSIQLQSSQGASITSNGGASFGGKLLVSNVDVTPSVGDLNQREYAASNNVSNSNVVGLAFSHPIVKSFVGVVCVTIETFDDTLDSLFDIKGLKKKNGWIMQSSSIGDDTGIVFAIDSFTGQVNYTSPNIPDWISTTMKFRATTTTI